MKLYFGLLNINERNVFHAQLRKVAKVSDDLGQYTRHYLISGFNCHIHFLQHHLYANFDQNKFQINDLALIELDKPVKYTNWVRPICLPNREEAQPGTVCIAAGWGLTGKRIYETLQRSICCAIQAIACHVS